MQTKHFSFLLLKQAKHKVTFTISLSKYTYGREYTWCYILPSLFMCEKSQEYSSQAFAFLTEIMSFQSILFMSLFSIIIVDAILSRGPPYGKNILHAALSIVYSKFTTFFHRLPYSYPPNHLPSFPACFFLFY